VPCGVGSARPPTGARSGHGPGPGNPRAGVAARLGRRPRAVRGALRQHHVEGRLTAEELEERTERAYAARTFGDLDALATDLPPLTPPAPAPGPPAAWDPEAPGLPPRMRPPGPRRAAAKANLLRLLLLWGLLSVVLIVIWAASGRGYFWPVWPILGFMLALGWQAIAVWSRLSPLDEDPPRRRR
jgi:uncharacterized protein DUF1707/2TM domain-containing protein